MPQSHARIARHIARPQEVPQTAKWIHINLDEQTLVAYEGDQPVYATLISTGLRNHATQTGLFQVERKFKSKTMAGKDENGRYEVGEVPWTMYYHKKYAVHGAYWHNEFGQPRSHGCVNVPVVDARWLFDWSNLDLPTGWHALYEAKGLHVYITGTTPERVEDS